MSRSGIVGSGDGIRVLVLSVGGGIRGIGGTGERVRAVDARDTLEVVRRRPPSRAEPPDVVVTRVGAAGARREDTELARGEAGAFVRWRATGDAGLRFVAIFDAEVVRVRGLVRVVVRLVVFVSDIFVVRVEPDKVRSRTLPPGTDKVVDDAEFTGFDRMRGREGHLLVGVVRAEGGEGGVVLLSVACLLFPTGGLAGSAAGQRDFSNDTLVRIT